jgi:hypothetical protein
MEENKGTECSWKISIRDQWRISTLGGSSIWTTYGDDDVAALLLLVVVVVAAIWK